MTEDLSGDKLMRLIDVGRSLVSELDLELLLQRLLDVARDLTGARYVAMGILDPEKRELERFITSGIDEETREEIGDLPHGRGVLGLLIRDAHPLRLHDVGSHPESYGFPPGHPPMHTFLGVPVVIRGEGFGNLYLTEKQGGGDFTDEDERSVVILAEWAAIAIENARLYQSVEAQRAGLERAVRGLEVTTTIARAVGGETDLDRVLELIAKRARALVDARAVVIMVYDGDDLAVAATAGELPAELAGAPVDPEGTVAAEVLADGRPQRVADIRARGTSVSAKLGIDAQSALVVPLTFRGHVLGALSAYDRLVDGPEFGREDEELMLSFAASAATAVHTARSVAEERLQHAIDAAEQERARWARELHDETLQGLGGLQMMLSTAVRETSPDKREAIVRSAAEHTRAEIERLRRLIVELRPAELDELGLEPALEALAERRGAGGLKVTLDTDLGDERLPPALDSAIYRIVQEALTNAAKHAGAGHARVTVTATDGAVEVTVTDDGSGFDPAEPSSGFGLTGMRERATLLGGSLDISSAPDLGATVRAVIPRRR
jgi:signal transduction histidine kinase